MGNTANRPSQSDQQYVTNSKGQKVINTVYKGKKNSNNSAGVSSTTESIFAEYQENTDYQSDAFNKNYDRVEEQVQDLIDDDTPVDEVMDVFTGMMDELGPDWKDEYGPNPADVPDGEIRRVAGQALASHGFDDEDELDDDDYY